MLASDDGLLYLYLWNREGTGKEGGKGGGKEGGKEGGECGLLWGGGVGGGREVGRKGERKCMGNMENPAINFVDVYCLKKCRCIIFNHIIMIVHVFGKFTVIINFKV